MAIESSTYAGQEYTSRREDTQGSIIETRSAQLEDLEALNAISIDRQEDKTPDYPAYIDKQRAWLKEKGIERKRMLMERALSDPEHYFMQVALVNGKVSGYAVAEAPANEEFTWWTGITVAREYEIPGLNVGRTLEADRQAWGIGIGRTVRARIPASNDRSLKFFEDHGFRQVAKEAPTSDRPFPFAVMQLRFGSHHLKTTVKSGH